MRAGEHVTTKRWLLARFWLLLLSFLAAPVLTAITAALVRIEEPATVEYLYAGYVLALFSLGLWRIPLGRPAGAAAPR